MAALTGAQVIPLFTTADAALIGLYSLRFVNTGDTIDLSTLGAPVFQLVMRATVLGITDAVGNFATPSGTVVTMPAGLTDALGLLTVWGM
jgi:hypothetical protein